MDFCIGALPFVVPVSNTIIAIISSVLLNTFANKFYIMHSKKWKDSQEQWFVISAAFICSVVLYIATSALVMYCCDDKDSELLKEQRRMRINESFVGTNHTTSSSEMESLAIIQDNALRILCICVVIVNMAVRFLLHLSEHSKKEVNVTIVNKVENKKVRRHRSKSRLSRRSKSRLSRRSKSSTKSK